MLLPPALLTLHGPSTTGYAILSAAGIHTDEWLELTEAAMRKLTGLEAVPRSMLAAEVDLPRLPLPQRPPPAGYRLLALDGGCPSCGGDLGVWGVVGGEHYACVDHRLLAPCGWVRTCGGTWGWGPWHLQAVALLALNAGCAPPGACLWWGAPQGCVWVHVKGQAGVGLPVLPVLPECGLRGSQIMQAGSQ